MDFKKVPQWAWIAGAAVLGGVLFLGSRFLSLPQLRAALPNLPPAKAVAYLPMLLRAMGEAKITTPKRIAAFLAQLAHESGDLNFLQEIWGPTDAQKRYEGRADLGNVNAGDGYRYRGRGFIQLTGRTNYRQAGQALGLNLEGNPDLAADPGTAFRVAAWYWDSRNLNALADAGDFLGITRAINGGLNGIADREKRFAAARAAMGLA